jgi:KaiC/GvpD/RAD55 family RecA-like ATPase
MEESLEIEKIKRVKTGIPGLDEKIEGGFPKGSTIVVTGIAGSGKSIFGMNFISEGCKNGEKCLFITVEQSPDRIVNQAVQFNWDYNQWEKEEKLKMLSLNPQQLFERKPLQDIKQHILDNHYERVVIDSITTVVTAPFSMNSIMDLADRGLAPRALIEMIRAEVIALIDFLQSQGITTVVVSQKLDGMPGDTYDMVSEFKGDGLILLNFKAVGNALKRTVQIKKLRETKIDGIPYNFDFTENGISIMKSEEV